MTIPLLAVFTAVVAFAVPGPLRRAAWTYRAPRLAILAWYTSAAATIMSVTAAAVAALLHWSPTHDVMCAAWHVCLDALTGAHGVLCQVVAVAGVAILSSVAMRLVIAWRGVITPAGRDRRRHLALLRLAGTLHTDLGATVLPDPDPAAYLVPAGQPQVVVTTGALDRLSTAELAAVLAHERAHGRGRHHRLRDAARLLHRAFPRVPVFAHAVRQVDRLVELCADDVAVRRHSALTLARALVTMAAPEPTGRAMHASGGDTGERLRRLIQPPEPLPRPLQVVVAAAWLSLPATPALLLLLGRVTPLATGGIGTF